MSTHNVGFYEDRNYLSIIIKHAPYLPSVYICSLSILHKAQAVSTHSNHLTKEILVNTSIVFMEKYTTLSANYGKMPTLIRLLLKINLDAVIIYMYLAHSETKYCWNKHTYM